MKNLITFYHLKYIAITTHLTFKVGLKSLLMKEEEEQMFKENYSPNRILIVTYYNKLMTLYCPFAVRFREDLLGFKKNQIVFVRKTGIATNGKYVFFLENKWFYYHHFDIMCYQI